MDMQFPEESCASCQCQRYWKVAVTKKFILRVTLGAWQRKTNSRHFLFWKYRPGNILDGIFMWKKERKITEGRYTADGGSFCYSLTTILF